ncbi:MAG: hypothetical protein U5K69_21795 [Balneolaceae bacterium]|nr:hypothetical protein [Balneolaceae bacterium]
MRASPILMLRWIIIEKNRLGKRAGETAQSVRWIGAHRCRTKGQDGQ